MPRIRPDAPAAAVLTFLTLAAPAAAHGERDRESRILGTVGFAVGSADIADVTGTSVGLHLDVGKTWGKLHLQGEYAIGGFSETRYDGQPVRSALLSRVGLTARYHFFDRSLGTERFRLNLWLEGGVGRQFWQWHEGGKLDRDELVLGFGFGFLGDLADREAKQSKWLGFYYDFRFTLADSPYADKHAALVCAGPCDEPTGPVPYDFGFMFLMGFNFGR